MPILELRRLTGYIFLIVVFTRLPVWAQEFDYQRQIVPFPVRDMVGAAFEFPFLGGFNAPRTQLVDIDGDSDLDLFVQEGRATATRPGHLMFFENIGTPFNLQYAWRTDSYKDLDVANWYKFIDMDADGDLDLFAESRFAFLKYYQNIGSATNADFIVVADSLRDLEGQLIFFDIGSLPELADIDCDGDNDLFIGRAAAGTISFYENIGLSNEGVPQFEFVTDAFENISIIGESGNQPTRLQDATAGRHGSNSLTYSDIDGDGVQDLFWGDLFEPSLVFLANAGTCNNPEISITTREFPFSDPIMTSGFNAPRFGDIDADGDLDMFIGVLGGAFSSTSHLVENLYFYENTSSLNNLTFVLRQKRFVSMVDVGANSIPACVDIDADGDLDMFLANETDPDNPQTSRLSFYENLGSSVAPAFQLASEDFLSVDFGINYAPAFVDIDADGDQDLFVGEWDGRLNFFENIGSSQTFERGPLQPNYTAIIAGKDSVIDVGNNNTPAFADIDSDGDFDLFMGEFLGNINFYENIGTPSSPSFKEDMTQYFDIQVGRYSYPAFDDLDADGDHDLLIGSEDSGLAFYRNIGSAGVADFAPEEALDLTNTIRSTPAFADIDADGDLELFVGTDRGGLLYYENRRFVSAVGDGNRSGNPPRTFALRQNYPNPFNPATTIIYELTRSMLVEIVIYNLLGEEVRTLVDAVRTNGTHSAVWDGKDDAGGALSSGIFFYQLRAGGFRETRRMLMLK